ncbi:hypothetical protein BU23DRAFT_257641 [Bimuria novae-zelandiae CBS 107.79]|uniref:F-box domain-containing protein n=1 Tax=Bimuria novae-zelandiae CBS 107.79 TaxID=1447943 RepID=A0A6A5V5V9_9PLEO|nr:hypothetical protein BU23DRAFT_257641 [Bimuria novae-zelandiae CBS 107.79]
MTPITPSSGYPRTHNATAEKRASQPTGITKPPRRRPRKTHPKVLGPLSTQYTTPSAVQMSRLLSLPPELRNIIWSYALTSDDSRLHYDSAAVRFDTSQIAAGLPATCHQTALETLYLSLRCNTLCFDSKAAFLRWTRRLVAVEGKLGVGLRVRGLEFVEEKG